MKYPRSILYVGTDSFFSQIESLRKPELSGKPVVVIRERGRAAGIVICASQEARECGIEDGMGSRRAQRKCPDAVIIKADYAVYRDMFENMLDILSQYTPLLEPNAQGSAYMDVTGSRNLFGESRTIAFHIIDEIKRKLGLDVRVGCGSSKLIAQVAFNTGERLLLVKPGDEREFLKDLPIETFLSVYSQMVKVKDLEKRLLGLGVRRIGQLTGVPQSLLIRQFGKEGSILSRLAGGVDESAVEAKYPFETIDIEHTCEYELGEPVEVEAVLDDMASDAYTLLKTNNMLTGEIFLRFYWDAESIPGYFRFKTATDSRESILYALVKLLRDRMKPGMLVYKVKVRLLDLDKGRPAQLCLFGTGEQNYRVDRTVEMIRGRFGEKSISTAASVNQA
jgi:DNA polymerase-4